MPQGKAREGNYAPGPPVGIGSNPPPHVVGNAQIGAGTTISGSKKLDTPSNAAGAARLDEDVRKTYLVEPQLAKELAEVGIGEGNCSNKRASQPVRVNHWMGGSGSLG